MISSIIVFLIVLSILVLVHELGHFIMARRAGIWVEEFGFGLPPRVWGKKVHETIYSINLFPFGGFVRLHGENTQESIKKPLKAYLNKSKSVRVSILVAGVIMNFILGIIAFAIVYSFSGIPQETKDVKVVEVATGSPAYEAGIIQGDVIKRVEGKEVTSTVEFINLIGENTEKNIKVEVERLGQGNMETKNVVLAPRAAPPPGEGPIGVAISSTEIYFSPIWQRPFYGIYYGVKDAVGWGKTVILGLVNIVYQVREGNAPKDFAGPVGIFALTSEAAKVGLLALINFVGILSINLAILNILPFPALDGGRLFFIVIETVFGKRVLPKVEAATHAVGMIILLLLILAITAQDIRKLIEAGSISGFIDNLLR